MRKIALFILALFVLLVPGEVSAACDYAEQNRLNALASNVNADYTVSKRITVIEGTDSMGNDLSQEIEENYFVINVYNLTEDIYIVVTNSYNKASNTYKVSDAKDGIISFEAPTNGNTVEFTIKVYTTNTECSSNALRTFTVRSPMVNPFMRYEVCNEVPDFYLCQEYLTSDFDITDSQFFERVNAYKETQKEKEKESENSGDDGFFSRVASFISSYWPFLVGGIVILGAIITVIVIIRVRRRVI